MAARRFDHRQRRACALTTQGTALSGGSPNTTPLVGNTGDALPCVARCVDASHRGPGLGRGWEKMRMQYHESIISQQAVATYVPLALWLAAWARRRGPPWEGDLRVEYERHPPRNAATSGLVPPAGEGAFLPLCQPSPVPRYSEHGYSGAKRICSFQLRRYLVVMHAWSTAQPSKRRSCRGTTARARCCSCRKEKAKQPSVPSSGSAQERGVFPFPVFLLCAPG